MFLLLRITFGDLFKTCEISSYRLAAFVCPLFLTTLANCSFALRTSYLRTLGYLSPSSYKSRFISPHYPLAFIFNNVCCYFNPCRTTTFNGLPSCCASNQRFPVRQRRVSFQSYWHSTPQDAYVPTQSI